MTLRLGGDYGPADESDHHEYYRVLPARDMGSFDLSTLLATVFKDSIVLRSIRTEVAPDTPGASYARSLKAKSNLCFIGSAACQHVQCPRRATAAQSVSSASDVVADRRTASGVATACNRKRRRLGLLAC